MRNQASSANLVMSWDEWAKHDAIGLSHLVKTGQVTPTELAVQCAMAIQELNPQLNAVIELFDDTLSDPYKDGMNKNGPFHGVPLLNKDITEMKGRLVEVGTLYKSMNGPAEHDHPIIENWRRAGFNIIGRTTLPELAAGFLTNSRKFGTTRNPWKLTHTPGGSSGGSAAVVAAGIAPIATGSDGGGSIRIPAAYTGLIGLKPTRGSVPLGPGGSESYMYHVTHGVLTRTVRDTALALDYARHIPSGMTFYPIHKPNRPYLVEVLEPRNEKYRIALSTGKWARSEEPGQEQVTRTEEVAKILEKMGHSVFDVEDADMCDFGSMWRTYMTLGWYSGILRASREIAQMGLTLAGGGMPPMWLKWLDVARKVTLAQYQDAQKQNAVIMEQWGRFFAQYDLLLCPTVATQVPLAEGPYRLDIDVDLEPWNSVYWDAIRYTPASNEVGTPAISLPAGLDNDGLPIGVQFFAAWAREDQLFDISQAYEMAMPEWFNQIPSTHVCRI